MEPGLAFDSWVTVGAKNSEDNNLWTIGVDYNNFLAGQELTVTDGAWFVVPTRRAGCCCGRQQSVVDAIDHRRHCHWCVELAGT